MGILSKTSVVSASATAGRGDEACSHAGHTAELGQVRPQTGLTWCSVSWVSGVGETTKRGINQTFYLLVEKRLFYI